MPSCIKSTPRQLYLPGVDMMGRAKLLQVLQLVTAKAEIVPAL